MIGKIIVYSLLVALISYEFNVYLNPREYTALVETVNGKVRGIISESRGGRRFGGFWGIPFAAPPLGRLRFAAPQPPENWTDIFIADREYVECIHVNFILDSGIHGVEDCLTLNVFTPNKNLVEVEVENGPKNQKEKPLLPVIVYIYGGGFMSGSSKKFKAAYFMDEDVILVTFNYRLGALGFLNTGDNAVKGNMGLKDQVMALRWVRDNIKNFGGDPAQVTIMGESAGGASVHLHMLSSLSKGLFQKAISLSEHALVPWALQSDPVRQAQKLGEQLHCPTIMSSDFLECLQSLDPISIARLHRVNRFSLVDPLEWYGPTVEATVDDETFLPKSPGEILESNTYNKVPWITGVNAGEGLFWTARIMLDTKVAEKLKNLTEWYKAAQRFLHLENAQSLENVKKITQYYFGFGKEEPSDFDPLSKLENMTNLLSDRTFHVKLQKLVRDHQGRISTRKPTVESQSKLLHSRNETIAELEPEPPLYLYYYTYNGQFSIFKVVLSVPNERILSSSLHIAFTLLKDWIRNFFLGNDSNLPPCHADEMPLLFNMGFSLNVGRGSKDYSLSVELVKMFSTFARKGSSLKFHGRAWPPVQPGPDGVKLMTLDVPERSGLISPPYEARVKFWDSLRWEN